MCPAPTPTPSRHRETPGQRSDILTASPMGACPLQRPKPCSYACLRGCHMLPDQMTLHALQCVRGYDGLFFYYRAFSPSPNTIPISERPGSKSIFYLGITFGLSKSGHDRRVRSLDIPFCHGQRFLCDRGSGI